MKFRLTSRTMKFHLLVRDIVVTRTGMEEDVELPDGLPPNCFVGVKDDSDEEERKLFGLSLWGICARSCM